MNPIVLFCVIGLAAAVHLEPSSVGSTAVDGAQGSGAAVTLGSFGVYGDGLPLTHNRDNVVPNNLQARGWGDTDDEDGNEAWFDGPLRSAKSHGVRGNVVFPETSRQFNQPQGNGILYQPYTYYPTKYYNTYPNGIYKFGFPYYGTYRHYDQFPGEFYKYSPTYPSYGHRYYDQIFKSFPGTFFGYKQFPIYSKEYPSQGKGFPFGYDDGKFFSTNPFFNYEKQFYGTGYQTYPGDYFYKFGQKFPFYKGFYPYYQNRFTVDNYGQQYPAYGNEFY